MGLLRWWKWSLFKPPPAHLENHFDKFGSPRAVKIVGFAPKTPEEVLQSKTQLQLLGKLLESLPPDDKQIAVEICELLLTESEIETLDQAITKLSKNDLTYRLRATELFNKLTLLNDP